jgi:hypothetical protein
MILLASGTAACGAKPVPEVNWGPWRVQISEHWPGGEAGYDWGKLRAGIGLSRAQPSAKEGTGGIGDYMMGWMAEGDDDAGIAGLLDGDFDMESRVEVRMFGRTEDQIQLVMLLHPTSGVLPGLMKSVVRRKMGLTEASRAPVTFADARSVDLGGKKVLFSGGFPEDLPPGTYHVTVELRDEAGKVNQRFERRFVHRQPQNPLAGLSDARLLEEYVKRGEALRGSAVEPIDFQHGRLAWAFSYESPPSRAWGMTHREIVRRGERIVPALMKMLETESVRNPGEATFETARFGFACDVMGMLREIGDPRPLSLLIRVMEGMNGKANVLVRQEAMGTAKWLTHATVPEASGQESVRNPDLYLRKTAGLYAKWLQNEGRDSTKWLALARDRARKTLVGNEPTAVLNAIVFLSGQSWGNAHDDRPEQTMQAIAEIIARSDRTSVQERTDWAFLRTLLADYGPAARPYMKSMIDQAKQQQVGIRSLAKVGGEQAVVYMVEVLPQLRRQVEGFGIEIDVNAIGMNDREAERAVFDYRACRWGIERWAGRTFASDQEIVAWSRAKGHGQREWLEENLDRNSAEADAGSAKAQYIIRCVLPDLPHAEDDKPFDPPWQYHVPPPYREKQPGPYRERWLRENRSRLEYDERQSLFTIRRK